MNDHQSLQGSVRAMRFLHLRLLLRAVQAALQAAAGCRVDLSNAAAHCAQSCSAKAEVAERGGAHDARLDRHVQLALRHLRRRGAVGAGHPVHAVHEQIARPARVNLRAVAAALRSGAGAATLAALAVSGAAAASSAGTATPPSPSA